METQSKREKLAIVLLRFWGREITATQAIDSIEKLAWHSDSLLREAVSVSAPDQPVPHRGYAGSRESLLWCPHCGSSDIQEKHDDGIFWHQCMGCRATGPTTHPRGEDDQPDWNTRAMPAGLPVKQETKYTTDGRSIVNRASGEPIPHDEPVFIFRARDKHAAKILRQYETSLPSGEHREAVHKRALAFLVFATNYPERIKEPDTVATGSPEKASPEPKGFCSEGDRCVCGGDVPAVRAGCFNWQQPIP